MPEILFSSPDYLSFYTQGCFTKLAGVPQQEHGLSDTLQQQVKRAFVQAERAGIADPILCGMIPFDNREAPQLFIPEKYVPFERKNLPHILAKAHGEQHITGQGRNLGQYRLTELPAESEFCDMVSKAVAEIKNGKLEKVVLSRLLAIETQKPLDPISLQERIFKQNPDAYCFAMRLDEGLLLGGSPELLLKKKGSTITSQPLAGSLPRTGEYCLDADSARQLLCSAKDRQEHQIVVKDIVNKLSTYCVELDVPAEPHILHAGKMLHLATSIKGKLAAESQETALSLACLLHPTPALCGSPTAVARKMISKLEPFARGAFGGIVGWCNQQGDGEWVVIIRCGLLSDKHLQLFAGAGIVADSQPTAEWVETGNKLQTMLAVLGMEYHT